MLQKFYINAVLLKFLFTNEFWKKYHNFHKNIKQHLFLYFVLYLYMHGETFVKNIKKKNYGLHYNPKLLDSNIYIKM